ncbi:MAG: hypothetical protein K2K81_07305 [Muribaculaceae bacterium]|nr:hypothetical protein [Muribaculaceae bacterium]
MTSKEKRLNNVLKRSERAISKIDKEMDNLDKARDKVSMESAEYYLLSKAAESLNEAKGHLEIVRNRIKTQLKEG